jgi:transcriptional regulator with XRE-family HTH domain
VRQPAVLIVVEPAKVIVVDQERLLSARELLGLSQAGLAEKLGVDRGTVGDWERGVRLPSEERLTAVEALLSPDAGKPD